MAARRKSSKKSNATGANIGYEAQLWQMADALAESLWKRKVESRTLAVVRDTLLP